ncbi:MAG: pyridoxal-phosphate dependent enzyme [Phycisphaerae bacterium]
MTAYAITIDDIRSAHTRIGEFIHRTPIATCAKIDHQGHRSFHFKCENLQKIGAFKARGATNAVMRLSDEEAGKGVVTHSSGNHAQALAMAARTRGIDAHIVMPTSALAVKKNAVIEYGGIIHECEPTLAARESLADAVMQETGATFIAPYNHPDVMAGQGTTAIELLEDVENLDALVIPVGGGGLLSGMCIAAKAIQPDIRIFAAEPSGADDAARSFAAGELIPQTGPRTIADGLLTSLGDLTWPIIRDHIETVITVDDTQIIAAMKLVWERMKLVIEPSAATTVAAVLSEEFMQRDGMPRVGVVLSGGNADLGNLPW